MIHTIKADQPPNSAKTRLLNMLNYLCVIGYWHYSYWERDIEVEL